MIPYHPVEQISWWETNWAERWRRGCTILGLIPGRGRRFPLLKRPDRYWCPPSLLFGGYRAFFHGDKAAEADRLYVVVRLRLELYFCTTYMTSWRTGTGLPLLVITAKLSKFPAVCGFWRFIAMSTYLSHHFEAPCHGDAQGEVNGRFTPGEWAPWERQYGRHGKEKLCTSPWMES